MSQRNSQNSGNNQETNEEPIDPVGLTENDDVVSQLSKKEFDKYPCLHALFKHYKLVLREDNPRELRNCTCYQDTDKFLEQENNYCCPCTCENLQQFKNKKFRSNSKQYQRPIEQNQCCPCNKKYEESLPECTCDDFKLENSCCNCDTRKKPTIKDCTCDQDIYDNYEYSSDNQEYDEPNYQACCTCNPIQEVVSCCTCNKQQQKAKTCCTCEKPQKVKKKCCFCDDPKNEDTATGAKRPSVGSGGVRDAIESMGENHRSNSRSLNVYRVNTSKSHLSDRYSPYNKR